MRSRMMTPPGVPGDSAVRMSTLFEAPTAAAVTVCGAVDDARTPVTKHRATQTRPIPDAGGFEREDQRNANNYLVDILSSGQAWQCRNLLWRAPYSARVAS